MLDYPDWHREAQDYREDDGAPDGPELPECSPESRCWHDACASCAAYMRAVEQQCHDVDVIQDFPLPY